MRYQAQKGFRIKTGFKGFKAPRLSSWWWNRTKKEWQDSPDLSNGDDYSTHQPCNSVRAFRRKLKQAPSGVEFTLISRWKDNNITAKSY